MRHDLGESNMVRTDGMRNFALLDEKGNEIGTYSGKQPRQAALKAANRGFTDIRLREKGTKKIHVFKGTRILQQVPEKHPKWMDGRETFMKGHVEKVGIYKL